MDNLSFTINSEVDKIIREKCPTPNWGNILFTWMTPFLQDHMYNLAESYYNKPFLEFLKGVKFEYGINCEINIEKAYECYLNASLEYESNALYKMYTIHNSESSKFKITRDKNLEMYYLLKSMAYSDSAIFFNNDTLYNIDILYEIALTLDLEDPFLDKTNRIFIDMRSIIKDEQELRFVEALTLIKFNVNEDDLTIGISILQDLADNAQYNEAIYKLACIYTKSSEKYIKQKDPVQAEKYFKILEEKNFYKCFNDYGYFLYYEDKLEKSKEILFRGVQNGNNRCFFLYYDLFLSQFNFEGQSVKEISDLQTLLVNDVVMGNAFSLFEFFYMRKVLNKHFKYIDEEKNQLYETFAGELLQIMKRVHSDKSLIEDNFIKGIVETEFLLSYGFINYTGIDGLVTKDHFLAEKLLKESFRISANPSYQRFCFSYIYKIRCKRLKEDRSNKEIILKAEKTKNKIFKIYMEAMDKNNLDEFSSSYFYYLAKLYENGCNKSEKIDPLFSYCYYYHASIAQTKFLGTGSIISYFRRFKAKKKLLQIKYIQIADKLQNYKEKEISQEGEDSLCYICYENNKDIMYYPCKHMTCKRCFEQLKSSNKCPHCRGKIILTK
jgi:DNA-directed RNA polymerase subunit RPC12/RpoP